MRRLAALALTAAALGTSALAAAPAYADELATCIVIVGFEAGPRGVSVDYVEVKSVSDCI
jgi:hypothetical protein